ncbi:MAG TPA: transcription termination factor Rho [Elusimicrobiota bacterium]|jgi:transcription termination factor Rho|nr:transcription termination factor Rho [Elusimicrobiota bacterium]
MRYRNHHRRQGQGGGGHGGHGGHGGGHGGGGRGNPQPPRRSDAEEKFIQRTPLTPFEWIEMEKGSKEPAMRAVDLLSPVGKGTRGLIVSPPKAGKTTILKQFCQAAAASDPKLKILCFLVDERPEEVTDFRRSVTAEVFASSNDQGFQEHIRMSENVYQKALSLAVEGNDVLIVLDSLTRLARAYNTGTSGSKTLSGGLDSRAMETPRKFFGAARKIEEGGSITILATILVDTGSRMDEVIFQEFKGTGNMELVLSRQAAEARVFPAIHVKNSGTRREELLLPEKTLQTSWKLRRLLAGMSDIEATKTVTELIRRYPTNEKLLAAVESGG